MFPWDDPRFPTYEKRMESLGKAHLAKYEWVEYSDVKCPKCGTNRLHKGETWNRGKDESATWIFYCPEGHFFTRNQ